MGSLNKGHFGGPLLSFVRRLSSLGGSKCIGTIGKNYFWTQAVSFVGRVSLFCSIHYWRFQCILNAVNVVFSLDETSTREWSSTIKES